MNAPLKHLPTVEFKLNDQSVQAYEGESILKAAQRNGVDIPHLCYTDGLRADGNCRACVVEIKGERTLAPSCCRTATAGLEVLVSDRAVKSQKMVLEMLLSDMPDVGYKWNDSVSVASFAAATGDTPGASCGEPKSLPGASPIAAGDVVRDSSSSEVAVVGQHGELSDWAARMGVSVRPELRALRREQPACDVSHPAMAVNLDACIQCNRCVRACREEQVNDVIGYANRGAHSQIVFDLNDPMGLSSCVACGECVQACPTGALMPNSHVGSQVVDKKLDSF